MLETSTNVPQKGLSFSVIDAALRKYHLRRSWRMKALFFITVLDKDWIMVFGIQFQLKRNSPRHDADWGCNSLFSLICCVCNNVLKLWPKMSVSVSLDHNTFPTMLFAEFKLKSYHFIWTPTQTYSKHQRVFQKSIKN